MLTPVPPNSSEAVARDPSDDAPAQPQADVPTRMSLRERVREALRQSAQRLPATLINLGTCLVMIGKMAHVGVEYSEVLRQAQRRMRAEGLARGRDDARARTIAAEELSRYRDEFNDEVLKFEIKTFEAIDPWRGL